MQPTTLLVCVFALLSNSQFTESFTLRDDARLTAQAGIVEIERQLAIRPNSFLFFHAAKNYEESGRSIRAEDAYSRALEHLDMPTAILLLDEAPDKPEFQNEIRQRIRDLKKDSGAVRIPLLGNYFLHQGLRKVQQGEDPEDLLRLSIDMDPLQPASRLVLMGYYARRLNPSLYNELVGLLHSFRDFSNQYAAAVNGYVLISIAFTITFFLYLIGLLARHMHSIYHSILSLLPTAIPHQLRLGIVAFALILPIVFGLHTIWLWTILVILLIPFCTAREKTLLFMASFLLLISPLFSYFERNLLEPGNAHLLQRAQVSPYSPELVDSLRAVEASADSSAIRYSIGLLEKRGGNFADAHDSYVSALSEIHENGALHNNLGNVLFSRGDLAGAAEKYEEGIQYSPDLAALHYNLAQANLKLMRFDEYTEEIEIANKLDFELVTDYVNDSSEHPNRLLIDEKLRGDFLWRRVFLSPGTHTLSPIFGHGETTNVILGLVFLLALILIPRIWKTKESYCSVCGAPACRKCSTIINEKRVCDSCTARLKLTKSVGIQERISVRIAERKVRLKKLAGALLSVMPGLGHLFAGSPYKGFLLLFVSTCVAFFIVHRGAPYMPDTYAYGLLLLRRVLLIVYFVLVGIAVLDVLKVKLVVRRWR